MRRHRAAGFGLVELQLSLLLGLLVCAAMLRLLLLHGGNGERLALRLRERTVARRAFELVRLDVLAADRVEIGEAAALGPARCPLAGRRPVLRLSGPAGVVIWSQGAAPSAIWRGQVLMRCGPAFDLHGAPSGGDALNRVVLDALAPQGFRAHSARAGWLRLELEQQLGQATPRPQITALELAAALP